MSWPSPNDPNTVIQGKQGLEGRGGEGRGRGGRGREGKEGIVYTLHLAVSTPYLHTLYVNGIE